MGAVRDGSIRALYPSRSRPYCRPQHAPNARQQQRSAPAEMAVEVGVVEVVEVVAVVGSGARPAAEQQKKAARRLRVSQRRLRTMTMRRKRKRR